MHYVYLRPHGKGIPGNQLVADPEDTQTCKLIADGIIEPVDKEEAEGAEKKKDSRKKK